MVKGVIPWPCLINPYEPLDFAQNQSKHDHANPKTNAETITQPKPTTLKPLTTWKCLFDDDTTTDSTIKAQNNEPKQNKTFAQGVSNLCDIPTSQLPQPVLKGDKFLITIPEEEYVAGMDTCKYNLHARVIWPKGAMPLTMLALRNKLSTLWSNLSRWGITSLGKGFYEFTFSCLEDVKRVRSISSWNLNPGIMKLFTWSRDFNPKMHNSTSAQVWVQIHGLAQEYWRPRILFAIPSSVGTPICTDAASSKPMMEQTFGQYARVLVDMDVTQTLRYKVLVERNNFAFFVELDYENLPDFCTYCKKIGHYMEICKNRLNEPDNMGNKDPRKHKKEVRKEFVQTNDRRQVQGNDVENPIAVEANIDSDKVVHSTDKGKSIMADQAEPSGVKQNDDLVQGNRFEVLVDGNEAQLQLVRDTMKENDLQLEREINEELARQTRVNSPNIAQGNNYKETSSIGSEFVDATQHGSENMDNSSSTNSAGNEGDPNIGAAITISAQEKLNKDFLIQGKHSWKRREGTKTDAAT